MRSMMTRCVLAAVLAVFGGALQAGASVHLMQIEQIIAGVNGDVTAQAIQLRMRNANQRFTNGARLRVWDANGMNPIVVHTFVGSVAVGTVGSRILICTPSFAALTSPPAIADATITLLIPPSYFAAGKLTFETGTTTWWAVAWGGLAYTGTNMGNMNNDSDGQFSPAFSMPVPSASTSALQFPGLAIALSTNNLADYIITPGASTWVNNAGVSFALMQAPPTGRCCTAGGVCQIVTEVACTGLSGQFTPGALCDAGACAPDPTGQCCTSGNCQVTTQTACDGMLGQWTQGAQCDAGACVPDPTGACCNGSICSILTQDECEGGGGTFGGEGVSCAEGAANNFIVCCRANFDEENGVGVPDIFAFLAAWFASDERADFDDNPGTQVPDIFAFLGLWFAGCS